MLWRRVRPIAKTEGNMKQHEYISNLNDIMLLFCDDNMAWMFRQNNNPQHTVRSTKRWMAGNTVTVTVTLLDWSSCSLDLNPIKNL